MTNRETNTANRGLTTLTSSFGPTDLTATVDSTADLPSSPCYLVIDPDDDAKAEVIYFDGAFTGTTVVTSDVSNRYLAGSAAGSGITHDVGAKVAHVAGLSQLWTDINDRVDAHAHGGGSDGAQVDHGGLAGLTDDDHTQYYNAARHTKALHDALGLDHGSLSGLADFTADHGTEHDAHDHSAAAATIASADLADHTKATHDALALDHGLLTGIADDDHTQYLNTTRHDAEHTSSEDSGVAIGTYRNTTVTTHGSGAVTRTVGSSITLPATWNTWVIVFHFTFELTSSSGTRREMTVTPKIASTAVTGQSWSQVAENNGTTNEIVSGTAFFTGSATGVVDFDLDMALSSADANVSTDDVTLVVVAYRLT